MQMFMWRGDNTPRIKNIVTLRSIYLRARSHELCMLEIHSEFDAV
jgi:hypothetical protein